MFIFCFNDCIPQSHSNEVTDRCLENSLKEYHKLSQLFPDEVSGIVTSNISTSVNINQSSTLYDCVCRIAERELRIYAHSVFRKYPVDSHYVFNNEAELIDNDFYINVGGCHYDAMHPFVVVKNQGVLFSLAVHSDICRNQLPIFKDDIKIADADNLYGCDINTNYIVKVIQQSIYDKADNFNKLLIAVGKNRFSERFQKKFESFPTNVQQSIIGHFVEAKKRNLPTPFSADKDMIKDVTPEKETKIKIFELRIFEPVACRVYFYETADCIYLGSVENKPNKKTQSSHINTARSIIKELVAL